MPASEVVPTACPHCTLPHPGKCPLVKAVEYHENGTVRRVEFFTPADYAPAIFANPPPVDLTTTWARAPDLDSVKLT